MDIQHIARVGLGMAWGYLLCIIISDVGTTVNGVTMTAWDAVMIILAIVVIIVLGIITFAAIVKD